MTDEELDDLVLRVVCTQSPGYLITPFASAFRAVDLNPDDVEMSLARLEMQGHTQVTQVTTPAIYEEGTPVLDEAGEPVLDDEEQPVLHGEDDPVLDENGDQVMDVHDEGWETTKKGSAKAKTIPSLDELYTPLELPNTDELMAEERQKRRDAVAQKIHANEKLDSGVKDALTEILEDLLA